PCPAQGLWAFQPRKVEPCAGIAVRVSDVEMLNWASQVVGQSRPTGELVTWPEPLPLIEMSTAAGFFRLNFSWTGTTSPGCSAAKAFEVLPVHEVPWLLHITLPLSGPSVKYTVFVEPAAPTKYVCVQDPVV